MHGTLRVSHTPCRRRSGVEGHQCVLKEPGDPTSLTIPPLLYPIFARPCWTTLIVLNQQATQMIPRYLAMTLSMSKKKVKRKSSWNKVDLKSNKEQSQW